MPNAHDIHADCKSTLSRSGKRTPKLKRPNSDTKRAASCRRACQAGFPPESRQLFTAVETLLAFISSEKLSCLVASPYVSNRTPRLTVILFKHIFSKNVKWETSTLKTMMEKNLGNNFYYILKIVTLSISSSMSQNTGNARFGAPIKKIPPK